jgi:hypothetical protein
MSKIEPLDQLIRRANVDMKQADDLQLKAGRTLQELKDRITERASLEGQEWGWNWRGFVQAKLDKSYSHVQRLISFVNSADPEKAVADYRQKDAAKAKERRQSQTSENDTGKVERPASTEEEQLAALERAWAQACRNVRLRFLVKVHPAAETMLRGRRTPARTPSARPKVGRNPLPFRASRGV